MTPFNRTVHRARNQGRRRGIDLVLERCEDRVLLSTTYAVTTTEDALDISNQPVVGSLRWAIDQANANAGGGAATIVFDIPLSDPGAVFISSSPTLFFDLALNPQLGPLTITQPVVIDGFTEADYLNAQTEGVQVPRVPLVMINGSALAAQSASASLIVQVPAGGAQPPPGATIEGLAFAGMSGGAAILLQGGQGDGIEGDLIGTDITGTSTTAAGRNSDGVAVSFPTPNQYGVVVDGSNDDLIGGPGVGGNPATGRDVISGNTSHGILIENGSQANLVENAYIGTDVTGTATLGNGGYGVVVDSTSTAGSTIGGTIAVSTLGQPLQGTFNLISGNSEGGVELEGGGSDQVSGNLIGTDITGTVPLGNGGDGIDVIGAPSNRIGGKAMIGGTAPGTGNLISANSGSGVSILGTEAAGTEVLGNLIGTDISQAVALGNANSGVVIAGSTGISIGTASTGNRIAGNRQDGVDIVRGSSGNTVVGDTIGGVAGTQGGSSTIGNAGDGVLIVDSPGNTIGSRPTQMTAIGTPDQLNLDANLIVGNGGDGVLISMSESFVAANSITGNLVARNGQNGIHLSGDLSGARSLAGISDNYVGTLLDGTSTYDASGQPQGNGLSGILLESTGTTPPPTPDVAATVSGNVVSNNGSSGVTVRSATTATAPAIVLFENNAIGTDKTGQLVSSLSSTGTSRPFGNATDGILLDQVTGVTVGGTAGLGNVISGNRGNGVDVLQASSIVIAGNEIGTDGQGFSVPGGATSDLGNASDGIFINQSSQVTVGGTATGAGNIVSGNHASGVFISGLVVDATGDTNANQNVVEGNRIGVGLGTQGQTTAVSNAVAGVILSNAGSNTVGGTAPGAANVISGNSHDGIVLVNDAIGNAILDNLIGTDPSGTVALGNSADGLLLLGTDSVTIGGVTPNSTPGTISGNVITSNVIAGNNQDGIRLLGTGASQNAFQRNWIGLSPGGTRIANGADGVLLDDDGPRNVVGGPGQGNIISGNNLAGVEITVSPPTAIEGNFIGTDPTGQRAVGNGSYGVLVSGSSSITIGGATASPGTGPGNVISGNSQAGIQIINLGGTQAVNNVVLGNLVGTNAAGTAGLGNGDGIEIENASDNTIGDVSGAGRNVISGNVGNGVLIVQSANLSASGNQILGNFIGTDAAGKAGLGNRGDGVEMVDGSANVIGGISGGATLLNTEVPSGGGAPGNLISGNGQWGVLIELTGASAGQPQSVIQGNVIGLDALRTSTIGNGQGGVFVNNLTTQTLGQTIGGSAAGAGNLITGNANVGIQLVGPQAGGSGVNNVVQGNLIGLNADGRVVNLGGGVTGNGTGILVNNSPDDLIGGTSPADRNVISGNSRSGIQLANVLSTGDLVLGNYIGTNLAGNAFPTGSTEASPPQDNGVLINGASGDTVGQAGAPNVISGNAVGVQISGIKQNNGQYFGSANLVAGNLIGTDASGTQPVSNLDLGVFVNDSQGNVIGPGNVMSANGIAGAEIFADGSQKNLVTGNIVGTGIGGQIFSSRGRSVLSSNGPEPGIPVFADAQLNGVVVLGASQNTIGVDRRIAGSAANTINGNVQVGVYITSRDFHGKRFLVPVGNSVSGNVIRSDGIYGVLLFDAPNNPVRPFTSSSRFLVKNQFGGRMINFRDFQSGFDVGTSLPTRGKKPRLHTKAAHVVHRPKARHEPSGAKVQHHATVAHVLQRARPRVPALFEPEARR